MILMVMVMVMILVVVVVVVMMMTISLFQLLPESVTNMERGRYYRNRLKSSSLVQIELRRTSCIIITTCVCEGSTRSRRSGSELTAKIIEAIGPETSRWIITIMKHALKPFFSTKYRKFQLSWAKPGSRTHL